jgi:hypothetical protein
MTTEQLTPTRQPESPKRFFQILRQRAWYHHRLLAKQMAEVGFTVRRVVRQANHANVWGLYFPSLAGCASSPGSTLREAGSSSIRSGLWVAKNQWHRRLGQYAGSTNLEVLSERMKNRCRPEREQTKKPP